MNKQNENCIVYGCTNKKYQGQFVGDICYPCYTMITEGNINQISTNFIYKQLQDKIKIHNYLIQKLNELETDIFLQLLWKLS